MTERINHQVINIGERALRSVLALASGSGEDDRLREIPLRVDGDRGAGEPIIPGARAGELVGKDDRIRRRLAENRHDILPRDAPRVRRVLPVDLVARREGEVDLLAAVRGERGERPEDRVDVRLADDAVVVEVKGGVISGLSVMGKICGRERF